MTGILNTSYDSLWTWQPKRFSWMVSQVWSHCDARSERLRVSGSQGSKQRAGKREGRGEEKRQIACGMMTWTALREEGDGDSNVKRKRQNQGPRPRMSVYEETLPQK